MSGGDACLVEVARMTDTPRDSLEMLVKVAVEAHDGHLTLLRFTTGWKGCFGTMDLHAGADYEWLRRQPSFASLDELAKHLVKSGLTPGDEAPGFEDGFPAIRGMAAVPPGEFQGRWDDDAWECAAGCGWAGSDPEWDTCLDYSWEEHEYPDVSDVLGHGITWTPCPGCGHRGEAFQWEDHSGIWGGGAYMAYRDGVRPFQGTEADFRTRAAAAEQKEDARPLPRS